jgi:hypothetical protein
MMVLIDQGELLKKLPVLIVIKLLITQSVREKMEYSHMNAILDVATLNQRQEIYICQISNLPNLFHR